MTTPVWISLGSNLGDRRAILDEAVTRLGQTPGVAVTAVSTYRETRPVGGPPGQGPFLNAAAQLETSLSPRELLGAMQAIERDLGRVRTVRWGERTLDLDILIYDSKFVDEPDLKLPHPRLAVRRFVLSPLVEIAPGTIDTITRRPVAWLLDHLDQSAHILMLAEPTLADHLAAALEADLVDDEPIDYAALDWQDLSPQYRSLREVLRKMMALQCLKGVTPKSWTMFRFAFDLKGYKQTFSVAPEIYHNETLVVQAASEQPSLWLKMQIAKNLEGLPDPTLIVAAPNSKLARRPGVSQTPVYWPEATEADAIVAEVTAVCRGIADV